jgi:hypothetical protein
MKEKTKDRIFSIICVIAGVFILVVSLTIFLTWACNIIAFMGGALLTLKGIHDLKNNRRKS